MATSLLQIVDPDDLVTPLFDLNDQTGANSADYGGVVTYLTADPNWGAPSFTYDRFQAPDGTGGQTAFSRADLTTCQIGVRIVASSYDNLETAVGRLSRYLALGAVLKWQPLGSVNPRYIDCEPSLTPALLSGRALGLYEVTQMFDTPEGVTLSLMRQPYMRGPEIAPELNILTNSTMMLDSVTGDKHPDNWTITSGTGVSDLGVSDSAEAWSISVINTANGMSTSQITPAASVGNSQTWTFSFYAKVASVATAQVSLLARFQPLQVGGASNGSSLDGVTTLLTTSWQRITASGTTPGSLTDHAQLNINFTVQSGSATTVYLCRAQFEQSASASMFRCGVETVTNDPAGYAGRVLPFVNVGDAPAPVKVTIGSANNYIGLALRRPSLPGKGVANFLAPTNRFIQAEAMTALTDTATFADGAGASGSGNNTMRTTFATSAALVARFKGSIAASTATAGQTMAVWLRARADGAYTGTAQLSWALGGTQPLVTNALVPTSFDTAYSDIPLGTVTLSQVGGAAPTLFLSVALSRASGSANILSDFLWLSPVDSAALISGTSAFPGTLYSYPETSRGILDAGATVGLVPLATRGPVPFAGVPPGLSAISYQVGESLNVAATGGLKNSALGGADGAVVRFTYSPRYY